MGLNTSDEVRLEDRREKAWELRVKGHTYRSIAKELSIDVRSAFDDIKALLDRRKTETNEDIDHHRAVSLARIERAIRKLSDILDSPDDELSMSAMDRLEKLEKRKAALLGTDAPERKEVELKEVPATSASKLVREAFGGRANRDSSDGSGSGS